MTDCTGMEHSFKQGGSRATASLSRNLSSFFYTVTIFYDCFCSNLNFIYIKF